MATAQIDPKAVPVLDATVSLRDALEGLGISASWIRDQQAVDQITQQQEQEQQVAKDIAAGQGMGDAMQKLGQGAEALNGS